MSVIIPDLKVYEAIYKKIDSFRFRKVCDINYCNTLSLEEKQSKAFVTNLLKLNEMSYNAMYEGGVPAELFNHLKLNVVTGKSTISTLQLLKYLHCIKYNIELYTIEKGRNGTETNKIHPNLIDCHKLLLEAINELQYNVISILTNYEELKYCDI